MGSLRSSGAQSKEERIVDKEKCIKQAEMDGGRGREGRGSFGGEAIREEHGKG